MDAHQNRFLLGGHHAVFFNSHTAEAERQVGIGIHHAAEGDEVEVSKPCRQGDLDFTFDEPFALAAVLDQVLDGAHFEVVPRRERPEVGQARHGTVFIANFANHRGG